MKNLTIVTPDNAPENVMRFFESLKSEGGAIGVAAALIEAGLTRRLMLVPALLEDKPVVALAMMAEDNSLGLLSILADTTLRDSGLSLTLPAPTPSGAGAAMPAVLAPPPDTSALLFAVLQNQEEHDCGDPDCEVHGAAAKQELSAREMADAAIAKMKGLH